LLASATPANALSYTFFYTNQDPNVIGQNLNGSPNSTLLTASGVLDINRNAGQTFTNSDISNVNITVTDGTSSFVFTSWSQAGGVIAANGLSASFNAAGNPVAFPFPNFFGCNATGCADNNDPNQFFVRFNNGNNVAYFLNYNNQANALAAFQITSATPVPFEFSPAVGVVGLGVVFGAKKFMSKKATKK
jgi:hypothetical protein